MTAQFGQYNPLAQFAAGIAPGINRSDVQMTGQYNPLLSQIAGGVTGINPLGVPTTAQYGIDPRVTFGGTGQQFGFTDPNVASGLNNPGIAGDPIALLMSQQLNPLVHQQLPIRSLIDTPQNAGFQQNVPGIGFPVTQWPVAQPIAHLDPYRAFIEAQLISQLAANPLYQLQHQVQPRFQQGFQQGLQQGYGVPETTGLGVPGVGQQFNPLYGTVPFCG
jgi:hypothetical protein